MCERISLGHRSSALALVANTVKCMWSIANEVSVAYPVDLMVGSHILESHYSLEFSEIIALLVTTVYGLQCVEHKSCFILWLDLTLLFETYFLCVKLTLF